MSEQCLPLNVTQRHVHHSHHLFFVKLLPSSTWTKARPSRRGTATFGTQNGWTLESISVQPQMPEALCPSATSALILDHPNSFSVFSLPRGHPRPHGGSSAALMLVIPSLPCVDAPLSSPHAQTPPFDKLLQ